MIKLLWTLVYRFLFGHILWFLLNKCLGVKWLDNTVSVCLTSSFRSLCKIGIYFLHTFLSNFIYGDMKKVKVIQSCPALCDPVDYRIHGLLQARILERVAFPFSRDLPNPGIKSRFPHHRQILYQLSHKGSTSILEWVAYPFSCESSSPRNWTGVSCIAGGCFTNWATREAPIWWCKYI